MNNAYPEKPLVPFVATTVPMSDVIAYLKSLPIAVALRCSGYTAFRIESGNGQHGVNNNYVGFQADGARWPAMFDDRIVGIVDEAENGTGRERLFLAFDRWQSNIDLLVDRFASRELCVGGTPEFNGATMSIQSSVDLARAYHKVWVTGNWASEPSEAEVATFTSIYAQALREFSDNTLAEPPSGVYTAADQPTADELMADELAGKPIPGLEGPT